MRQRIKVLFLCSTLDAKTGSGRFNSELIKTLESNFGLEKIVVTEKRGGGGSEILPDNRKNPIQLFHSLTAIKKLSTECGLIHVLDGWPNGFYGSATGKPLVITLIGTYAVAPLFKFPSNFLLKHAYVKAKALVGISKYTAGRVAEKLPHLSKKITVINPGIDQHKFTPSSAKKENFILSVGALKKRKGYHISIPAFAMAREKLPDLRYRIVGSISNKKYFDYIKQVAKDNGVLDAVDFISNVSDDKLVNFYQEAKLFILTSVNEGYNFEGFGLVFLEAAAAGLPVIGTENNGIEDAIWNGYNGLLVPQNSIKETADAIVEILSNPKLSEKMSSAGLNWAKNHLWANTASQYIKIYEQILEKNS